MSRGASWLLFLCVVVWPGRAWADDAPNPTNDARPDLEEARRLFHEAVDLQESHDVTGALERYARARAIAVSPQLLFNMASCEEALGRYLDASRAYEEARAEAALRGNEDVARAAAFRIDHLSKITPRLVVRLPERASDATLTLDGRAIAPTSEPRPIDLGEHRVVASSERAGSFELVFTATAGESRVVEVVFPKGVGARIDEPRAPATPAPRPAPSYLAAGIAAGTSVVLASFASATFVAGRAYKDDYDALNAAPSDANAADRRRLKADGETMYVASTTLGVAAALAAGAAVFFFVRARVARSPKSALWLAPSYASGGGATLGGAL